MRGPSHRYSSWTFFADNEARFVLEDASHRLSSVSPVQQFLIIEQLGEESREEHRGLLLVRKSLRFRRQAGVAVDRQGQRHRQVHVVQPPFRRLDKKKNIPFGPELSRAQSLFVGRSRVT